MISCEELTGRMTDYLDGRVPMGEKMGMWLHLALCHHCRRYLRQMKQAIDLMGEMSEDERGDAADRETRTELLAQFRKRGSTSRE